MSRHHFLRGKTVLITGASSGIGAQTAIFLANKGLKIILVARRLEKLEQLAADIREFSGVVEVIQSDLTIEAQRTRLFETLKARDLNPDILINNAGMGWYGYFHQMPWELAKNLISLNVEAVVHMTQMFLPHMVSSGYGHVINIGSISGKLPEQGIAVYAASKAFLDAFTTSTFRDLVGSGVKVTVVRAGPIKTEFFDIARNLENGGNVPAEKMATSSESVARGIWRSLLHPRKVVYIPWYLFVSPLLETLFSPVIDLVGPILLRKKSKTR
jgi:uncharacterized protein